MEVVATRCGGERIEKVGAAVAEAGDGAWRGANAALAINIEKHEFRSPHGGVVKFDIDPHRKHCLLSGLDDIGQCQKRKSSMSDTAFDLIAYAQRAGSMYGVEDLAVFLYALTRMHKPKFMVELGSGCGACSLLCARAMRENGVGRVLSFDNGSQWEGIRNDRRLLAFDLDTGSTYHTFLKELAIRSSVEQHVTYVDATFPPFPEPTEPIDVLFSDYNSAQEVLASLLSHFLPRMAASASIFIDGASASYRSFLFMEKLIGDLNRAKLPAALLRPSTGSSFLSWLPLLHTRRFTLVHLTRQHATQNSTTWIKIEPVDHLPYPTTQMR